MTTATLVTHGRTMDTETARPRRSLEELVDRLIEALFPAQTEAEEPSATRDDPRGKAAPAGGGRRHRAGGAGRRGHVEGDAGRGAVGLLRVEADSQAAVRRPGRGALHPGRREGRRPGAPRRRRGA